MRKRLTIVTLTMVSYLLQAQQPCVLLKGTVIDRATGSPLPGANVTVKNMPGLGTSTNVSGQFEWRPSPGDTIVISFIGYVSQQVTSSDCVVTIRLEESPGDLSEVVIKSERLIAEEFTVKKIRKLDIYTNPSAKADPILAVNSTPSATTLDESANISLRGSTPAETGIFLNNVPINDAVRYSQLNGIGTFSIFNTALVSQVLVYPGNPPLEFGSTTSGLIALQTDEVIPEKPVRTLSLTLASMGLYYQGKLNRRSSITVFTNYQPSVLIRALNPESLQRVKNFNSIDIGVHYLLRLNDNTLVKVFTYGIRESYQYAVTQPTFSGDFHQHKYRNYTIANLRHRLPKGEITVNTALSFSQASYTMSTLDADIANRDFFASFNYQRFGKVMDVKAGLSYDTRQSHYKGQYPVYPYAMGEQYPVDSSESDVATKTPEGYIYMKWFATPRITIGTGLRNNLPLSGHNAFTSGQVNVNYKPNKSWSIIVAAGRYNKYQLPQGESNDPFHIMADQYSLDVSRTGKRTEYTLALFHKKSNYLITTSEVSGVELFLNHRFNAHFRGQLSFTGLDANLSQSGVPMSSPYDIGYFVRGNLEYKFADTWTVTTVFLFRQGSYYVPVASATYDPAMDVFVPAYGPPLRLPAYNIVDLSLSKVLPIGESSAVVFAGIGNILNFRNVRGYSYNKDYSATTDDLFSLRTVYVGFIINF